VARRATIIKQNRSQNPNTLLLDAGNSLYMNDQNSKEPTEANQGQTGVEVLNRLGYDAVGLGDQDLALGKAELQKRVAEAKGFTFVSANLIDKGTGKLFVKPYVVKEVGGHRVALIGITGIPAQESPDFTVLAPLDAARDYVQRVRSEADIIILLSTAGAQTNQTLASQVPGIDIVLSGGSEALTEPVSPVPGTLVAQADMSSPGHAGRYIGQLQADFDRTGALVKNSWRSVELGPSVADDPEIKAWVDSLATPTPAS